MHFFSEGKDPAKPGFILYYVEYIDLGVSITRKEKNYAVEEWMILPSAQEVPRQSYYIQCGVKGAPRKTGRITYNQEESVQLRALDEDLSRKFFVSYDIDPPPPHHHLSSPKAPKCSRRADTDFISFFAFWETFFFILGQTFYFRTNILPMTYADNHSTHVFPTVA